MQDPTDRFALEQMRLAEKQGLKRKNELMAWTLCALVHGPGFDVRIPQVREIVEERVYDRSMLLTLLAVHGMKNRGVAA